VAQLVIAICNCGTEEGFDGVLHDCHLPKVSYVVNLLMKKATKLCLRFMHATCHFLVLVSYLGHYYIPKKTRSLSFVN